MEFVSSRYHNYDFVRSGGTNTTIVYKFYLNDGKKVTILPENIFIPVSLLDFDGKYLIKINGADSFVVAKIKDDLHENLKHGFWVESWDDNHDEWTEVDFKLNFDDAVSSLEKHSHLNPGLEFRIIHESDFLLRYDN